MENGRCPMGNALRQVAKTICQVVCYACLIANPLCHQAEALRDIGNAAGSEAAGAVCQMIVHGDSGNDGFEEKGDKVV